MITLVSSPKQHLPKDMQNSVPQLLENAMLQKFIFEKLDIK